MFHFLSQATDEQRWDLLLAEIILHISRPAASACIRDHWQQQQQDVLAKEHYSVMGLQAVFCTWACFRALRTRSRESGPMPLYARPMFGETTDIFLTVSSSMSVDRSFFSVASTTPFVACKHTQSFHTRLSAPDTESIIRQKYKFRVWHAVWHTASPVMGTCKGDLTDTTLQHVSRSP